MVGSGTVRTVARLGRLLRIHAYLDFKAVTRSGRVFCIWYLSDLVLSVGSVAGMLLLASRFDGIGVWSAAQVTFMLGYAALVGGVVGVLFSYNISHISRRLGRGQLDHTLIQPQPLWMSLMTEGFCPAFGSALALPGLALLIWSAGRLPIVLTMGWVLDFVLCVASSSAIVIAFQFIWGSLAFRAPRGAEEISSSTMGLIDALRPFPLDGVGPGLTGCLLTIVPTGFVGWFPCRHLLGIDRAAIAAWGTPLAAVIAITLAIVVFRNGLAYYERTGSTRYLDMGHRR